MSRSAAASRPTTFFSELDGDRRRALAEIVAKGGQTVITATARAALPIEPAQTLAVSPGRIR